MYKGKSVLAVLLARRGSMRLKDKMVLPFGKSSVVDSTIERIKGCKLIDSFVLATTVGFRDEIFKRIAEKHNIDIFCGSEKDVVSRMSESVHGVFPQAEVVVRACCDNPLVMPTVVDEGIMELVDKGGDMITPFECNTYPFGYSMVVMTKSCLEKIEREARDEVYREHVENYCFENTDRFKILYHKAPESLHLPHLIMTLDYKEDYKRLKALLGLLEGIPLEEQPRRLVEKIRKCRVGIALHDEGKANWATRLVRSHTRSDPVLEFVPTKASGSLRTNNSSDTTDRKADGRNIQNILSRFENEELDLIISSEAFPSGWEPQTGKGAVTVGVRAVRGEQRYCLLYSSGGGTSGGDFVPLFTEPKGSVAYEKREDFLFRVLPLILPRLICGYPRSGLLEEGWAPPAGKCGEGESRGSLSENEAYFPREVFIELVKDLRSSQSRKRVYVKKSMMRKAMDELRHYDLERVVLGTRDDPREHPGFAWMLGELSSLIGYEKINVWPEVQFGNVPIVEEAPFRGIVLAANGFIRYLVDDPEDVSVIGDMNEMSLLEAWHSKEMLEARVDELNSWI